QLGVHGDGLVGVGPQGVERLAGPGGAAPSEPTRVGAAQAVADGVRDLSRVVPADAVPTGADGAPIDLPIPVVEPVARGVPAAGGAAASMPAVLTGSTLKSGSGCPDPRGPSSAERGLAMETSNPGRHDGVKPSPTCGRYVSTW